MAEESVDLRKKRAKSSTLPEELEKLAEDKDELVRFYLAGNTNTPISLLEKLAQDEDEDVRSCVAGNTNTPVSLLEKLVEDEDEIVRSDVAGNANTPAPVLEKLAEDEDEKVRFYLAGNVNTPVSVLEKLAKDKAKDVRVYVAENANTPVSVLEKLAKDKAKDVRIAVAENANTPVSVLGEISKKILIKIKSRLIAGWIAEFSGEECKKIKAYCNDEANNEDIDFFFGGPQQEKLVQNVLEDEYWDMYERSLEDFAIWGYCPLPNSEYSDATIEVKLASNVITDDWEKITIKKKVVKTSEWKKMYRGNDAIAYSYGYISDDEHDSVFSFDEISDFDVSNLSLIVVTNEFYEYEYIEGVQYLKNDGETLNADFEGEDFEGDYFDALYFET